MENFKIPNSALSNIQIDEYAQKLKLINFIGHRMRDELKGKPKTNECGIINTDVSSGEGFHYVCYFKKGDTKIYFDSFGLAPLIEIQRYLGKNILYSTFRIQKINESNCGKHCLYMLHRLNKGDNYVDIVFDLLNERGEGV